MSLILSGFLMNVVLFFLKVSGNSAFPPPLTAKEEREYFDLCKKGDMEARNILIERNLRLVAHIAKKYYTVGNSTDNEDIISVGTIGLIKAIDSFNPSNGTRFATYAGKCLQNEILMYFRAKKKFSAETSLSDAVEIDKDGNPLTYMDIIACEDTIADDLDLKMRSQQMIKALNRVLDDRQREIIILRYGLCEGKKPLTQREVADKLKISRSYVSRIEKSALGKLKCELSECKQNYFSL
ncbi:MAG: sigma-70 family RNA polymerase sigma factor [Ruminococcaceae bacterium]|nr:sigma-70 family RNA polymerase sigma factor [Oscillospiraceae bacterium]